MFRSISLTGLVILVSLGSVAFGAQTPPIKIWVYFSDKGPVARDQYAKFASTSLSTRAILRRQLRGKKTQLFDFSDLPLYSPYIDQIKGLGIQILRKSRWLNAVSIMASQADLALLESLPFIEEIEPVAVFARTDPDIQQNLTKSHGPAAGFGLDYGSSSNQIQICNVHPLLDAGLSGNDVLIALLDTGFFYEDHPAFQNLKVVAERDFINGDSVTSNESGDSGSQHNHGSWVLSVIGGYLPGTLIGPAYNAEYALAKTENISSETRIEEDNWVAAAEWADSLGADIISTSLGYLVFDDGFIYDLSQLDGQSMVTSIAASMAVEKGIAVVTSAGNEGTSQSWPYIWSPADGIGVISVGGVDPVGQRVSFSSIGPTADGRIKPDVMAMASSCAAANISSNSGVLFLPGTSFAAPMVAGICAMILEAFPETTPADLLAALTSTASNSDAPDNFYGYGIANAEAALEYVQEGLIGTGQIPESFTFHPTRINTSMGFTRFTLDIPRTESVEIKVFNLAGQNISTFEQFMTAGFNREVVWNWPPSIASGLYFVRFSSGSLKGIQKTTVVR